MSRPSTPPQYTGDETTITPSGFTFQTPEAPPYSPLTPVAQVSTGLSRAHLSDSEPDQSSSSGDSSSEDSEEEMPSDITFSGKASELPGVLAHCKVTFLAKASKFSTNQVKSAYLASLFRGTALEWLGTKLGDNERILDDWAEFQKLIQNHFGISTATKERIAEQAIHRLRQTGSAQKYANDFDAIAEELNIEDDAKINFFRPGLKSDVAKALVGRDTSSWTKLRRAAIEIDEELYALRQRNRKKAKGVAGGGTKKDSTGKH